MSYLKFLAVVFIFIKSFVINEKTQAQNLNESISLKIAGYQMIVSDNINSKQAKYSGSYA